MPQVKCFDGPFTFRVGSSRKGGRIRGCGSLKSNEKDGDIGHEAQSYSTRLGLLCLFCMDERIHTCIYMFPHTSEGLLCAVTLRCLRLTAEFWRATYVGVNPLYCE